MKRPSPIARSCRLAVLVLHGSLCIIQFALLIVGNPGYETDSWVVGCFIFMAALAYALPNIILSCLDHESAFLQSGLDLGYSVTQLVLHIAYASWMSFLAFARWCQPGYSNNNRYGGNKTCPSLFGGLALIYLNSILLIFSMIFITRLVPRRLAEGWEDSWRTGTDRLLMLSGINPGPNGGKRSWRRLGNQDVTELGRSDM